MTRRFVVHIGMHKTGTSSVQHSLFTARNTLLAAGIDYFGHHENHSHLAALAVAEPRKLLSTLSITADQDPEQFVRELTRDFDTWAEQSTAPIMVISGEGLSRLRAEDIARFREHLEIAKATIEIHVYVRPPFGFAQSAAQQALKTGATRKQIDDATFVTDSFYDSGDGLHATARPNYRRRIEPYLEAFGPEGVHIHRFEPDHLIEHDAVVDFCNRVLQRDFASLNIASQRVNESIGPAAAVLLQALNERRPPVVDDRPSLERSGNLVQRLASANETDKFRLSEWDWSAFAACIADDIAWLNSVSGIDYSRLPAPEATAPEPNFAEVVDTLNDVALRQHDDAIQAQIFRSLYFRSIGRSGDDWTQKLNESIARSRNPHFLANLAHLLRIEGDTATAELARNRSGYLDSLRPDLAGD